MGRRYHHAKLHSRQSWRQEFRAKKTEIPISPSQLVDKNSSGDEIENVNFYAVRPEATRIRWNNAK